MVDFHQKKWKVFFWIAAWATATILALVFCIRTFKLTELNRLMVEGVKTTGVIIEKNRENHQRIRYNFSVNSIKYTWGGFAGDLGKGFDQISVGETVLVTYEKENPQNSVLGNPENTFYPNLRLSIFISLFPTIAGAILGITYLIKNAPPLDD